MSAGKFVKKCSSGKCAKCSMQKENHYERPKSYDSSEEEFMRSLARQYGRPGEKFSDGYHNAKNEDILLPPTEELEVPKEPMQVVEELMERIKKLEEKV